MVVKPKDQWIGIIRSHDLDVDTYSPWEEHPKVCHSRSVWTFRIGSIETYRYLVCINMNDWKRGD